MTPRPMPPPWRTRTAVAAGSAVSGVSRLVGAGRGSVVGGRAVLLVDPDAVDRLAAGRGVTLVSGTNGKTTTTRMVAEALRTAGPVAHNGTGANMPTGIVTALARAGDAPEAALEVDEAHLPEVLHRTRADVVVLLNLSRDQLDRNLEVKRLAALWRSMLDAEVAARGTSRPLTVVANADDPLVAWAAMDCPRVVWVSGGQWWTEDSDLCPSCLSPLDRSGEAWRCPSCGLARPAPDWAYDGDEAVGPHGVRVVVRPALPGRANRANALTAVAAAAARGLDPVRAAAAVAAVDDVDGRYLSTRHGGHDIRLLLGKNPASWTELLAIVAEPGAGLGGVAGPAGAGGPERGLVVVINARGADGRDPSWLWDVPFERIAGRTAAAAGERRYDLAVRLDVAGVRVSHVRAEPLDAVTALPPGPVDVVANYTAFQDLRERLTRG